MNTASNCGVSIAGFQYRYILLYRHEKICGNYKKGVHYRGILVKSESQREDIGMLNTHTRRIQIDFHGKYLILRGNGLLKRDKKHNAPLVLKELRLAPTSPYPYFKAYPTISLYLYGPELLTTLAFSSPFFPYSIKNILISPFFGGRWSLYAGGVKGHFFLVKI